MAWALQPQLGMRMRNVVLCGMLAAAAVLAPRAALACGQGGNYGGLQALAVTALVVGGVDTVLTLYDGGSALAAHHPSAGYGVFETVVAVPQVVLGVAGFGSSTGGARTFFGLYSAWMTLVAAHGIWTVSTAPGADPSPATEPAAPRLDKPFVALAPTCVPLGQQALPGFGLAGRF